MAFGCNDARFGVLVLLLWQPKAITDVALTNRPFMHRPIPWMCTVPVGGCH